MTENQQPECPCFDLSPEQKFAFWQKTYDALLPMHGVEDAIGGADLALAYLVERSRQVEPPQGWGWSRDKKILCKDDDDGWSMQITDRALRVKVRGTPISLPLLVVRAVLAQHDCVQS